MRSLRVAFGVGATDIVRSFRRITLWAMPGWFDFILGYRRTLLGPFWETVAMALWIGGLGVVFSYSLGEGDTQYMAYVGVGVVVWFYMSSLMTSSADLFRSKDSLILSANNPLYTYVLRHVVVSVARLLWHTPVLVVVLAMSAWPSPSQILLSALGGAALLLISLWMAALIGLAGARFADTKHGLSLAMRFLFFATPVFWRADALGDRSMIAMANPFTHFLEVVRAPLLGEPVSDIAWTVVLATSATGIIPTVLVYGQYSRRLVFWL